MWPEPAISVLRGHRTGHCGPDTVPAATGRRAIMATGVADVPGRRIRPVGEAVWAYSSGNAVGYLRWNPPIMTSRDAVTKTAAPAQEARHSRNQPRMVRPRLRQAPSPHTDSQKWTIDMPLFNAGSPAIGYSHRHFACPGPCWGNDQEILGSGLA